MKLKNTLLASALLSATAFSVNAATELTPEQAAAVKPFDRVVVTGRFNAIGEAVKAVSRRADKEGACRFNWSTQQLCENMGLRRFFE